MVPWPREPTITRSARSSRASSMIALAARPRTTLPSTDLPAAPRRSTTSRIVSWAYAVIAASSSGARAAPRSHGPGIGVIIGSTTLTTRRTESLGPAIDSASAAASAAPAEPSYASNTRIGDWLLFGCGLVSARR
jgi:hypothetical protein